MRKIQSAALLLALLAAPAALAAEPVDLKPPTREKDADANYLLYSKPRRNPSAARGLASADSCTDDHGVIYNKGAVGYDACLRTQNLTKPEQPQPGQWGNTFGLIFVK